jgi:hypothetical protein
MEETRNQIKNGVQREIQIEMLYTIYPGLNIYFGRNSLYRVSERHGGFSAPRPMFRLN